MEAWYANYPNTILANSISRAIVWDYVLWALTRTQKQIWMWLPADFFQLKKSAMGHLISHCHWAAVRPAKVTEQLLSPAGVPQSKSQQNIKGSSVLGDELGTPAGLWVSVRRHGRKDSSRLQWHLNCVKHISPLGKQLLSLLLQVKMVACVALIELKPFASYGVWEAQPGSHLTGVVFWDGLNHGCPTFWLSWATLSEEELP